MQNMIFENPEPTSPILSPLIYRGESHETRRNALGRGPGLGLPIVRRLVEAFDGKITVSLNTEASNGTKFTVTIPLPKQ